MPFLTEELWQRLPRRPGDKTPSIVIAKYPQHDSTLEDDDAEASYELLLGCSKGIRSLMAEYAIKEDGKGASHSALFFQRRKTFPNSHPIHSSFQSHASRII